MSIISILKTKLPFQSINIESTQEQKMSTYYRFHAKIYDMTRWTFLFGRHEIIDWLPFKKLENFTLLEVGCGTGYNLKHLSRRFPQAQLIGLDASSDMLQIAHEKLGKTPSNPILVNDLYGVGELKKINISPNVVMFSYCLTMVNPNWEALILQAKDDLKADGLVAIVDFHDSPSSLFKKWMGKNHVRMDGHILPFLNENFETQKYDIRRAYLGLWHYTLYIGQKKAI